MAVEVDKISESTSFAPKQVRKPFVEANTKNYRDFGYENSTK